jgi:folate-binding protein YgfZ
LIELKKVLEKYKIRIKCELNIVKEDVFFEINEKEDTLSVKPTNEAEQHIDWSEVEMAYELPSLKIIESGLLPNEIKWLESFVDFYKGCFMGQEQASRVKFRGNPRRILKTLPNSTQEIVKK